MTEKRICRILAHWDPEGDIWVATSHDIKGLALGAPTEEELVAKLRIVVPDLLKANFGAVNYDAFAIDYIRETVEDLEAA